MVHQVPDKAFWDSAVKQAGKLLVVDFYADWCGPCKHIAPTIQNFSEKYQDVAFLKVDVDNEELASVCQEYEVNCMPTFLFLKDGKVLEKIEGADEDAVEAAIKKHIS